ncbi:MAG: metal-dependent transcriptional regulator [Nitrospirae bacterium]|nr:metal-dependent transcriptional regulator [Nitrospirota bacterium]MDA8339501.1 metal-dependent transcriptional regulator [Nitrospiraceae bacterium]
MKLSDKAEEILEHLWIMTYEMKQEMANFKDLKTERDAPEVTELLALNYISVFRDGIRLRKEGMKEAENAVRRHRLAERLMVDVLDLKKPLMEETACRFEHLLHKDVEESICTLLGHPAFCPHGKPIPQGRCCKKSERAAKAIVSSLADVDKEAKGKVAYLHTRDNKKLQKLMAMGLLPGVSVEVIQRFPSYVLKIGNSQIAMDEEMARDVFIRLKR